MPINDLPHEILSEILLLATKANQAEGERYTYGLSQAPLPLQKVKLSKYVRGPVTAESLRWDATASIRQVCSTWHEWALSYNLEHVFERRWRGSERWAELPVSRGRRKYSIYELIDNHSGFAVYRDPFGTLKTTDAIFRHMPHLTRHVRRLWFNGFYTADTDKLILSIVSECHELQFLSVPWTVLRRSTAEHWIDLLNVNTGTGSALHSLELQAVCLPKDQAEALEKENSPNALHDPRVDFSALKRLKIFGNTLHKPICDDDLHLIAHTATNLQVLDITNLSTISVAGMLALVKASHSTLQVLEHSPRSDDGFYHPYPGHLPSNAHICTLLTSLPKMRDLSISVPYLCSHLFASPEVHWQGELQVRATDLCSSSPTPHSRATHLRELFSSARSLIHSRTRLGHALRIEIFFAGCIFEPEKSLVHGDFVLAEIRSRGQWPRGKVVSTKGPYGTTGVYGKEEDGVNWDAVDEEEYLRAVERGWVVL
ncbi:uncharacterized protein MYCFIDRAFT_51028 [Pseudocercospora fijiensis CIRAD86]|uniref:F-box domain-containing protein n=1 Tax=Pseudocercospora fijiensis (strain CIRAD86) TaxID=383855 RepID=M2ZIY5_PSEFD|nr:uncharacterized protein MYCFIDRAFT_51028 [Pseudocercospora fijiensis CIRAD86]EME79069.1 hypothetical protein MYCFIDRAFT_51028 [Pseudocercospora fijiensis CIRAD86]